MLSLKIAQNSRANTSSGGALLVALAPRKTKGRLTRRRPNLLLLQRKNGGHDKD